MKSISRETLYTIANDLDHLVSRHQNGELKHIQYVNEYSAILENHGLSRRDLVLALELLKNDNISDVFEIKSSETPKAKAR